MKEIIISSQQKQNSVGILMQSVVVRSINAISCLDCRIIACGIVKTRRSKFIELEDIIEDAAIAVITLYSK